MKKRLNRLGNRLLLRGGVFLTTAILGLAWALTVVVAQGATFEFSKTGPAAADTGDYVAYTIVVENISDDAVSGVTLTDPLPNGTEFFYCVYQKSQDYVPYRPCTVPELWREDLDSGERITTTLIVRVTAGTNQWPLKNCATLRWVYGQEEECFTTLLNPLRVYLPMVLNNYNND